MMSMETPLSDERLKRVQMIMNEYDYNYELSLVNTLNQPRGGNIHKLFIYF